MNYGAMTFFEVEPLKENGWSTTPWPIPAEIIPAFNNDDEKKKAFGIELAKSHSSPFAAACEVFPDDTQAAIWVTQNWMLDPVVNAAKDLYTKAVETGGSLLDKNQLLAKILKFADEKDLQSNRYVVDAKERISALKLYAEIQGYVGKVEIDQSTNYNHTNNEMKILLVRPANDIKEPAPVTIDNDENEEEIDKSSTPISLKLVSAR